MNQEADPGGMTIVASCNRFNKLVRQVMLWTLQHLWLAREIIFVALT